MKKFEYKTIYFRASPEGERFDDFLQRMGNDGWELCVVLQNKGEYSVYFDGDYIFKREINE